MRRPLACTSIVFVMVLFLLQSMGVGSVMPSSAYGQGDTVVVCGQVADYSPDTGYGRTTTELHLKNIQILPCNKGFTKENDLSNPISESDYISSLEPIGTKGQRILVYLQEEFTPIIGSSLIVSGRMAYFERATNPGEFDPCRYYTNRGYMFAIKKASVLKITTSGNVILQKLKEFRIRQETYLEEYLPDGNDAIMKAMLFGNKKEMDKETKELYQKNGIAHILAISGLHISLLGMAVYKFLLHLPMPKWCILLVSGTFLIFYCLMVGLSASAFRALVMFSFFLLSKWLKRSYDMITAMAFSAMSWLLFHPGYLFDCGFQLSYGAIMGMAIVLPALTKIADTLKVRWIRRITYILLPSLSVNLMTAPILIYHYHELSFFSILLNLIVIPLMAPLLLCGIVLLAGANLIGGSCRIATFLCAIPVNLILRIYEWGCRLLECFPIGRKNMEPLSLWELIVYYVLLVAVTVLVNKKCGARLFLLPLACILLLLVPKKPGFSVWMLDVGQGDGNVIFTDEGDCYVIDCGSTTKNNVGEKILIPFLKYHGVAKVDGIIVSHPDADHMNGIGELIALGKEENINIGNIYIYENGTENEMSEWEELLSLAEEKEIPVCGIGQGDVLQTETFRMECLYPLEGQSGLKGNASSLVIGVWTEDFFGVFTGDMETEGEKYMLAEYGALGSVEDVEDEYGMPDGCEAAEDGVGLPDGREAAEDGVSLPDECEAWGSLAGKIECDLLKVAHHGSSTSTSDAFLRWLQPECAVISCGENNIYGHPHKEVIERLEECNISYWITYEEGAICYTE